MVKTNFNYEFDIPTRTLFGPGTLDELHRQPLPGRKALVVISNGKSTRANGYLDRLYSQLDKAGVRHVLFDKVEPNPLRSTCMAGSAVARENGCDFIVALGGGSVMDCSKGIAVVATNDGDLWDYVAFGSGKGKPLTNDPLPIVAITTTAGTGSETDAGAVITHEILREKSCVSFPQLFPVLALIDPELTLSVPPKFTAYQGFDALFHSLEGYISNKANLMSDMYALTAIENIARNLPTCVRDGRNLEARTRLSWANTLSGVVMCVGTTTSEHSLEHALSAYHQELPHGAGLIMLSRAYFSFFIDRHVCDDRFIRLARVMGLKDADKPADFISALVKLQEDCGVADLKMSDYGITPDEFEKFAANAKSAMSFLFPNDRYSLSNSDCVAIYRASYK